MLSKQKRSYDREDIPASKRARANVHDLYSRNVIPGTRALELFADLAAHPDTNCGFAARAKPMPAPGNRMKFRNAARQLRTYFGKRGGWPDMYNARMQCTDRRGESIEGEVSFLLPHELLLCLYHFGDADVVSSRAGLDSVGRQHMAALDRMAGTQVLPVGFWQDGVPTQWDKATTVEVCSINLPGARAPWCNMRLPITGVLKHHIGPDTLHEICEVVAWSLRACWAGVHPSRRHDGGDLDAKRAALAGSPLPFRAGLCQLRGDWKMQKDLFAFPGWQGEGPCCTKCNISVREVRVSQMDGVAHEGLRFLLVAGN